MNNGKPRDPQELFYALTVPGNADRAFHFPVTGFRLEETAFDVAILEIGPVGEAISQPKEQQMRDEKECLVATDKGPARQHHASDN